MAVALAPALAGIAPAWSQDFSITNDRPADGSLADVMRQLQAWWEVHGYYPRHASSLDESGTVKLHLVIATDGNVWPVTVVASSNSASLDAAAVAAFTKGFVRPFPEGVPPRAIDLSVHYVLTHRHDQAQPASATTTSKANFTITNDPVRSTILTKMVQRTCTGTVKLHAVRNHPIYGIFYNGEAVFFFTPDGAPWVRFTMAGISVLSPVSEVGNTIQWTGQSNRAYGAPVNIVGVSFTAFSVWPDGENTMEGSITTVDEHGVPLLVGGANPNGTMSFTCATEVVPKPGWSQWGASPGPPPPGDPP
jgi:TonB family protein